MVRYRGAACLDTATAVRAAADAGDEMGQISVTLNGRTYRLRCGDGEEARLLQLADHVRLRVDALAEEFGQVGDDRLMLMAALMICDELWDAREQLRTQAGPRIGS